MENFIDVPVIITSVTIVWRRLHRFRNDLYTLTFGLMHVLLLALAAGRNLLPHGICLSPWTDQPDAP
jgi:hypothetical protein